MFLSILNGGNCLRCPWSLPWCPFKSPNRNLQIPHRGALCQGKIALPLQVRSIRPVRAVRFLIFFEPDWDTWNLQTSDTRIHVLFSTSTTLYLLNATECTNGKNLLQVVAFSRQVMSPCLMQSVAFSRLGVWHTTWILLQQGWYEWVHCTVQQNPPLQSVAFSRVGTWYEG